MLLLKSVIDKSGCYLKQIEEFEALTALQLADKDFGTEMSASSYNLEFMQKLTNLNQDMKNINHAKSTSKNVNEETQITSFFFQKQFAFSRIQGYLLVKIAHRFLLENSQNLRGS